MAFDVGSVVAHVKADLTEFNNGLNQAKSQVNGFTSHLAGAGDAIANLGKQAAVFTGVVAGGLALAAKSGVSAAAEFEQYDVAFNTLLKDRVKAQQTLKQIEEDAKKTPFELAPLVKANQLLISAGVSTKDARKDIINLGNAISAVGGSQADLTRLATNLQQIKAVGKASALDIKQFAFAGINVYEMLAQTTGKTVAEVKEMDVSYDLLTEAFADASAAGGMFEGAMEAQSKTFNGLMSTLKDTISLGLKDILIKSGAFDALRNGLAALIPFLETAATNLGRFFGVVSNAIGLLGDVMSGKNVLPEIREMLSYFMGGEMPSEDHPAVKFFYALADVLKNIGAWIAENQELVITFLQGLAVAVGALLVIGTVTALIAALTNPLVLVALLIAALFTAWQTNFLGIRDITTAVIGFVIDFFSNTLMPFFQIFVDWFTERWVFIQLMIQGVWNIIIGIIQVAWAIVYGIISVGMELLAGDWQGAWERVKQTLNIAWGGIKNIFSGILNFIKGWGGNLLHDLVKPFQDAWNKISELVNKIKDALDFTKRHSPSVVDIVKTGVKQVNRAMEGLEFNTSLTPNVAAAVVGGSTGGTNVANVTVDMSGAIISDELAAMRIGEKIGDSIIGKLKLNVRF